MGQPPHDAFFWVTYMSFTLISYGSNFPDFPDLWSESGGELLKICDSNAWLCNKTTNNCQGGWQGVFRQNLPGLSAGVLQNFYQKMESISSRACFFLRSPFFGVPFTTTVTNRVFFRWTWFHGHHHPKLHYHPPVLPRDHRCLPCCWKILSLGDPFIPQRKIFFTRQCQG